MQSRLRVAIYGAQHPHVFPRIELIQGHPSADFIGLWEPDSVLRATYAGNFGFPMFDSADDLIAASPDLVIVEGLDHQNPEVVKRLAAAGCDLLIEKPGANRLVDMESMVESVRGTRVHAQIGYMLEYSPALAYLRSVLDSGVLGDITLARFHASSPVGCAAELWQSLPDDEGGVTYTDGCHMVDIIHLLFGRPNGVQALVKRLESRASAQSQYYKRNVFAGLGSAQEFEIGSLMHEDCSATVFDYGDKLVTFDVTGWEARGWVEGWRIELYGTNGTIFAGLMPPWARVNVATARAGYDAGWHSFEGEAEVLDPSQYTLVPDATYTRELHDLIDRLRSGDRSQAGLERGLAVVQMLEAAFRSSRALGQRVDL
jgi:predicted dehydrogenase